MHPAAFGAGRLAFGVPERDAPTNLEGQLSATLSEQIAGWLLDLDPAHVPEDVVEATRLRVLDVVGLSLCGRSFPQGQAVIKGGGALGGRPEAHILGEAEPTGSATAALVNGALAGALEWDDTHNETIIHVSSPVVAAALATAEACGVNGLALVTAIAAASELTCRLGLIAPGGFHPRGFHPTSLIGTFGAVCAVAKLRGLSRDQTRHALGIAGSQAAGILESWSDETWAKLLHPGWAAHSAVAACHLAAAGFTGPRKVFEGDAGLFRTHLQGEGKLDFGRLTERLGETWESRGISFKPYPTAHVVHAIIDAAAQLRSEAKLRPGDIAKVICRIASFMVPVVAEPEAEKFAPISSQGARTSLHFTLAEVLKHGTIDADSYAPERLADPELLALSRKVHYEIDPAATDRRQFKGWVVIETTDGRVLERIEPYNLGSRERPMTRAQVCAKFRANATRVLPNARVAEIEALLARPEQIGQISALAALCQGAGV